MIKDILNKLKDYALYYLAIIIFIILVPLFFLQIIVNQLLRKPTRKRKK